MRQPLPTGNPRPDEWDVFLDRAISGLRLAANELRTCRAHFEAKRDWFRKGKRHKGVPNENSVSQALKQLFDSIRAEQQISGSGVHAVDLRNIRIECERPRPFDPGIAAEANPTDLSIVLMKDDELDLRIEAKTVLDEADLKREYLGDRGLGRFEDGANPYTTQPFGGMAAYVVDRDTVSWETTIGHALAGHVGVTRLHSRSVAGSSHHVSRHHVVPAANAAFPAYEVEVVHIAIEIDALPSRR